MFRITEQPRLGVTGLIIFQIILMNLSKGLACGSSGKPTINTCSTQACKQAAALLLASIDDSVDPCHDFYKFACGNFLKKSHIREDESEDSPFVRLEDEVDKQLHSSIEDAIADSDPRAIRLLKSFYRACMDTERIEKNSVVELVEILNKLGGWPILVGESWNETAFNWRSSMLEFRKAGFKFHQFLDVYVKFMESSGNSLVQVNPGTLGVSQLYLAKGLKHDLVKAYFKFMVEFAVELGADRERAKEELGQALDLEIKLANITMKLIRESNDFDKHISVEDLQKSYPFPSSGPNWYDYLNGIMQPHTYLRTDDIVNVAMPSYFQALFKLLDETPKRAQANLAFWGAIQWDANRLNERIARAHRDFISTSTGVLENNPRWLYCFIEAKDLMNLAVQGLYVRKHVPEGAKESAYDLIVNVTRRFNKTLGEVSWMEETTKKTALDKFRTIGVSVEFPDELKNDEKLNDFYQRLQIYPESYLRTGLSLNLFHLGRSIEKLDKPVDRHNWIFYTDATSVNAIFKSKENTIFFPAAVLQGGIFDKDNLQYINYAGLGSITGHEMMHGFVFQNGLFDEDELFDLLNWWDDDSGKEYLRRAHCFVEQYRNYIFNKYNLNITGEMSQSEALADNVGVKESYYAYETWEKDNAPEPRLPGLESYSPRQLFWMNYARIWCSNYHQEDLQHFLGTSKYTLNEYRAIGPLSNIPEFARDFKCPKGTPMNPENRCAIWR